MSFTKEKVLETVKNTPYGILVTLGAEGMTSRTMSYVYAPGHILYMLTHKGKSKLDDIHFSGQGLLHIGKIEEDITQSSDITIRGSLECIAPDDPAYQAGADILGQNNPMIADLLSSDSRSNYEMIQMKISSLQAWDYIQALSGEPKTVIL